LMISILVVAIIAAMIFPVFTTFQARGERAKCTANLRSLHVAAGLYVQDHQQWPQLGNTASMESTQVAGLWIDTLKPYGLTQQNWICPTVQHMLDGPDLSLPENKRVDYIATAFNASPRAPFLYPTQPWFAEAGNVHGDGNLIIFPDGHVESLKEFMDRVVPK
jgi:type II secretory pathway pseudopilin PulG